MNTNSNPEFVVQQEIIELDIENKNLEKSEHSQAENDTLPEALPEDNTDFEANKDSMCELKEGMNEMSAIFKRIESRLVGEKSDFHEKLTKPGVKALIR